MDRQALLGNFILYPQKVWIGLACMVVVLVGIPSQAFAGKVETVKKVVKETCTKDIPEEQLMDMVIAAYDCTPGADVVVSECVIKCLKENKGTVVGK